MYSTPHARKIGPDAGFSLVELVVAVALTVLVLLVVGSMFDKSNECFGEVSRTTGSAIAVQRALRRIGDDLKQAGSKDVAINTAPATHDVVTITFPTSVVTYRVSASDVLERVVTAGNVSTTTALSGSVRGPVGQKGFTVTWSEKRRTFLVRAHLTIDVAGATDIEWPYATQVAPRL